MENISEYISKEISENDVILFMKGTKESPMCGFSNKVSRILQILEVNFKDINVLGSEELREGIKKYSDWPTIPQLYVKGRFVGGCDIVSEMYQSGELQEMLNA